MVAKVAQKWWRDGWQGGKMVASSPSGETLVAEALKR
jgi:hypothetical protein